MSGPGLTHTWGGSGVTGKIGEEAVTTRMLRVVLQSGVWEQERSAPWNFKTDPPARESFEVWRTGKNWADPFQEWRVEVASRTPVGIVRGTLMISGHREYVITLDRTSWLKVVREYRRPYHPEPSSKTLFFGELGQIAIKCEETP